MKIVTYPVQFVGGHVDGKELLVYDLKPEYHWTMAPDWSEMRGNNDPATVKTRRAIYVRLVDTNIYVYKGIRE